jgi:hypothetical protein
MAAAYAFVGAFAVLSYLQEHPEVRTRARDEAQHAVNRLRPSSWLYRGPALEMDTILRDIAAANDALRHVPCRGGRFVVSVTHTGRPHAFLTALRVGPGVARLLGDVSVDVEWRPRRRRRRRSDAAVVENETGGEWEATLPVQRCTLDKFYSYLRPALQQITVEAAHGQSEGQSSASGEPDSEDECCICFAASIDRITPCAHGFCSDCYDRWRRQDAGCALCRAPLPASERWGQGSFILLRPSDLAPAEDAAVRVTPESIVAWLRALPLAC